MAKQGLEPLKQKRAAIALALMCLIVGCVIAQVYQLRDFRFSLGQHSGNQFPAFTMNLKPASLNAYFMLTPSLPLTFETSTLTQDVLINTTRSQIYDYLDANPGMQFRALCSALCLPVGLAEYHVSILVRAGLISFVRDGRYKRFFTARRYSTREMIAICLLRHKTAKRIIETLLHKKQISHCNLAAEVAISSQALTWQMRMLQQTEFVLQVNDGIRKVYSLDKSSMPVLVKCLSEVR